MAAGRGFGSSQRTMPLEDELEELELDVLEELDELELLEELEVELLDEELVLDEDVEELDEEPLPGPPQAVSNIEALKEAAKRAAARHPPQID